MPGTLRGESPFGDGEALLLRVGDEGSLKRVKRLSRRSPGSELLVQDCTECAVEIAREWAVSLSSVRVRRRHEDLTVRLLSFEERELSRQESLAVEHLRLSEEKTEVRSILQRLRCRQEFQCNSRSGVRILGTRCHGKCAAMILGHEAAGVVVAVGDGVATSRIGERVAIEPQRACHRCEHCVSGHYNLCPKIEFYVTPPFDGAFAEYAAIDADRTFVIPDEMSLEAAALCEPLSVGVWTCQRAEVTAGSQVLIAGAGPVGLLIAQVARVFGATRVVVSDPQEERRNNAASYADEVVDPTSASSQSLTGFDVFVDASGAAPAVAAGIKALKPRGRAVLVGMGADELMMPVSRIQSHELIVTGIFRSASTWPLAIELASSGRIDLEHLVSARFPLNRSLEALATAGEPGTLKNIVMPQEWNA